MTNVWALVIFLSALFLGAFASGLPKLMSLEQIDLILAKKAPHFAPGNEHRVLKLLHIITRHGIRTPDQTYPKDPHVNYTYWPTGMGELTNPGKLELYKVGQYIRKRYSNFLDRIYTPDVFYSASTDIDRTIATTQLINAGLWAPRKLEKWGPIHWQPVPTHTIPIQHDEMLLATKMCPAFYYEFEKVANSSEYKETLAKYKHTFEAVQNLTGKPMKGFYEAEAIRSVLDTQRHWNLTLPDWWVDWYPKLEEPAKIFFTISTWNNVLKKYRGYLLKKIIQDWVDKRDGTIKPPERQAFLYGGHDVTVANFMRTLNLWDLQIPRFGIFVLLELWQDRKTKEWGVEIYLRNETLSHPYLMTLPGCSQFCPLDKFIELTKDVIPGDWNEECAKHPPDFKVDVKSVFG